MPEPRQGRHKECRPCRGSARFSKTVSDQLHRAARPGVDAQHHRGQAAPDGYTLLAAPNVHVLARHVLKSVSYDPVKDFTPIARYGEAPLLVLANPAAVAGKTIAEALPAIRANPQNFRFGLSALGANSIGSPDRI